MDNLKDLLKKESLLYLMTAIIVAVIVFGSIFVYIGYFCHEIEGPVMAPQRTLVEKQLEQLDKLREKTEPLTEEEIEGQMDELEDLRKKDVSEKDVQKQLNELNNAHSN